MLEMARQQPQTEENRQLQLMLQQLAKESELKQKAQNYENMYSLLLDNVQKAQQKYAPMGHPSNNLEFQAETDRRILKQKQEFDKLMREYFLEARQTQVKKDSVQKLSEQLDYKIQKQEAIK